MKSILLAIGSMLAAAMPCAAQQAANRVDVRLLAFNSKLSEEKVYLHDPAADAVAAPVEADIKTYLNHEFFSIALTGRRLMITTGAGRDSMTAPGGLVGEITLPAGTDSAILLFLPTGEEASGRARVLSIADSKEAFPAGSFHVSNLSPQEVRMALESKPFHFKPGQAILIKDPPVRENKHSGMRAEALIDGQWRRIGSSLWPHPGRSRVVQILFRNPVSGQVQMKAFNDVPPRERKEEAASVP